MSVRAVGIEEGKRLREAGHTVVDVREPVEWAAGHVPGAVHIPLGDLPSRAATDLPDRSAPILLYCRSGARSGRAAAFLEAAGYTDVVNLHALIDDWHATGGPWDGPPKPLSAAQDRRYARQVLIPEIRVAGQQRLLAAKVLIVGAGGLGSPAALYLAAGGVGTIGIVDDDVVDESNLQRQLLHGTDRIGMRKVDSAEITLRGINPDAIVIKHAQRLVASNASQLIGSYDVIVDGSDNLDTRYVVNDAAVRLRRPVVHGSVHRWTAQVTTFVPFEGPCYRCMYPTQPPEELAPACDVAGVPGVVPGLAGLIQATEVLKLITRAGELLTGRLLVFDALGATFEEIRVERDPGCPSCGAGVADAAPDPLQVNAP